MANTSLETVKENLAESKIIENDEKKPFKRQLVWRNIILMVLLHISAFYGFILSITTGKWQTIVFGWFLLLLTSLGIQVGAHRYWCHRTFKAKLPLQIIMMFMQTFALQNDIYEWSRDHRVHHKYSDTDADPHNSRRGFWFAHVGWLLCRKHPDVLEKGQTMEMSDLEKDPIVRFQRAFYIPLVFLIWGVFPTFTPYYLWGETKWNALFSCVMLRYAVGLNITWCVNSAAHLWGMKPYDTTMNPVEASMRHWILGEGFHNYHHAFPWDYSASEFGALDVFNPATAFIDFFAWIGWAYDLKKASPDVIKSRQKKLGDINYMKKSRFNELFFGAIILFAPIWGLALLRNSSWYWCIPVSIFILHTATFSVK